MKISARINNNLNRNEVEVELTAPNIRLTDRFAEVHNTLWNAETGWAYQREMELLVESRVSPAEVIVAATMQNTRFFKIADRLDSIKKGTTADLIMVKGDPLKDIHAMRNVSKVMLKGVWVK